MKYDHFSSTVLLAHVLIEMNSKLYAFLAIISLFIFGLLLFRKVVRVPKGLFISSLTSYVLVLINILGFSFKLLPIEVAYPCFVVGIWPSSYIVVYINKLADCLFGEQWLFESGWWIMFDWNLCVVAFVVNTLGIFAIIRLVLYIKRKVSTKKPQVKQAV